jgi:hypothetical protein
MCATPDRRLSLGSMPSERLHHKRSYSIGGDENKMPSNSTIQNSEESSDIGIAPFKYFE